MRIIVSNIQPNAIPVVGIPTADGLYRAKAISESHMDTELAKHPPNDANGKPNPLHARIVEAKKTRAEEFSHEGKVYACVMGQIRRFDEATGEVGAAVDVKRWAEPFEFEQIVCTTSTTL